MRIPRTTICALFLLLATLPAHAMDAALRAKLDQKMQQIRAWAAEPAIVAAVKTQNSAKSADAAAMTQEKWAAASVLDPFVRALLKNPATQVLKSRQSAEITEAFVSSADGCKVAFLSKPTNWSHKGKPKHDVPMSGKTWEGAIELDESTGMQQLQVAVPVLDGGKPIGSLVIGLSLNRLGS
jgi:hypothetical protein